MRVLGFVIVLTSALAIASPALAQDEGEEAPAAEDDPSAADEAARAHFQAGTNYFQGGDYASALREYERSFELSRRPELLYNLYTCHERLGQLEEAIVTLDRFLAERPDIAEREALEARLVNLRERLAEQRASRPQADTEPAPAAVAEPPPVAAEEPSGGGGISTAALATLIAGGVLGLGWGAAAIGALVIDQDLEERCGMTCPPGETESLFSTSLTADVLLGLTAVTLIVGVVLAFTTSDDDGEEAVRVAPLLGPRVAGVQVSGALF